MYLANSIFRELSPALEHLVVKSSVFDLNIIVGEATLSELILEKSQEHVHLFDKSDDVLADYHQNSDRLYVLDRKKSKAYFLVENISSLTQSDKSAPLAKIFKWWMRERGIQLIHSACIGFNDKGILLSAKGGSGKSTTSFNCLFSDISFLSDDYCLVSSQNNNVKAYSIYNSAKLFIESVSHDPQFNSIEHVNDYQTEKALMFLHGKYEVLKFIEIKALFVPRIADRIDSNIVAISKSQAIKEIISHTLFHIRGPNKNDFDQLVSIVNALPCFYFDLGSDKKDITDKLKNFLSNA